MGAVRAWVPADLALPKMPPASMNGWKAAAECLTKPPSANPIPDLLIQMGPLIDRNPFDGKKPPQVGRPQTPNLGAVSHYWPDKPTAADFRVAKWAIEPYEARLRRLERAVAYPVWATPSLPDGYRPKADENYEPYLSGAGDLAKALVLRAYIKLDAGKPEQAVADIVLLRCVVNRLLAGRGSLGMRSSGESLAPIADHAAIRLAYSGRLTANQVATLQKEVANAPDPEALVSNLRCYFDQDLLQRITAARTDLGPADSSESFRHQMQGVTLLDRRETVDFAVERFRKAIENRTRPWSRQIKINSTYDIENDDEALPMPDRSSSPKEERDFADYYRSHPNALGRQIVEVSSSILETLESSARSHDARQRVTLAALALRRFEIAERRVPGTLAALVVTRHLAEVPRDPFTNEPLRYDAARRAIWSVGADGKDNGGKGRSKGALFFFLNADIGTELPAVLR